jgi:hypothetical protein
MKLRGGKVANEPSSSKGEQLGHEFPDPAAIRGRALRGIVPRHASAGDVADRHADRAVRQQGRVVEVARHQAGRQVARRHSLAADAATPSPMEVFF